ncbi:MAG: GPW/gp25 family protein [Clostridia bacterium]|nr:GPW/gp25 family protein [Clostridia bacterium]
MRDSTKKDKEFLGAGIAFPFCVDEKGQIKMNSLEDHIRQSIFLILNTAKGERVMRPDFGSGLNRLVFSNIDIATKALVKHEVEVALTRFEPRIKLLHVDVKDDARDKGVLSITLEYKVRQTDTVFNLVYPFYLERGGV